MGVVIVIQSYLNRQVERSCFVFVLLVVSVPLRSWVKRLFQCAIRLTALPSEKHGPRPPRPPCVVGDCEKIESFPDGGRLIFWLAWEPENAGRESQPVSGSVPQCWNQRSRTCAALGQRGISAATVYFSRVFGPQAPEKPSRGFSTLTVFAHRKVALPRKKIRSPPKCVDVRDMNRSANQGTSGQGAR